MTHTIPPYLQPVKMEPTILVRDKDEDSQRGAYSINPADFDPAVHVKTEAKAKKAAIPTRVRVERQVSTATADELAGMSVAELKKLPEFAQIPRDVDLGSKQQLIEALLKVRADGEDEE